MIILLRKLYIGVFLLMLASCAGGKKNTDSLRSSSSSDDDSGFMTYPLSHSSLTLRQLEQKKVQGIVDDLDIADRDDLKQAYKNLQLMIVGQRLLNAPLDKVLAYAKKLAEVGLALGLKDPVDQDIELEIALAAVQNKNYDMADYYLGTLVTSKDSKIRASALNAYGLIAKGENQIPEATQSWQEALKAYPKMPAAALNVGYTALFYGAFDSAQAALIRVPGDNFAASGVATAKRLAQQNSVAKASCESLLDDISDHPPTMFNCGLMYLQNLKDPAKGKKLISKAMKETPLPKAWMERGDRALSSAK